MKGLVASALLAVAACSSKSVVEPADHGLRDGVYVVESESPFAGPKPEPARRTYRFDPTRVDAEADAKVRYVTVRTEPIALLAEASRPRFDGAPGGKTDLVVTLSAPQRAALDRIAGPNGPAKVAVVIADEVVSVQIARAEDDGSLRIVRCGKEACRRILSVLE